MVMLSLENVPEYSRRGPGGRPAGEKCAACGGSIIPDAAGFRTCVQCGRNGSAPLPPPPRRRIPELQLKIYELAAEDFREALEDDAE